MAASASRVKLPSLPTGATLVTVAKAPSRLDILRFSVPMLGIGLASPLLSLVDSAVVGRYSAMQLAAMAPATALCDCSAYIFLFLGFTTTNFVATARSRADATRDGSAACG